MFPPEIPERIARRLVIEQRSEQVNTPCWVWTGPVVDGGYGSAYVGAGLGTSLHRAIYKILVGPIPDETLDHLCLIKACVNPDHMEPVSYRENKIRGMAIRTTCKLGHELDGLRKSTYPGSGPRRYCKTCQARMQREARARKKLKEVI